MTRPGGQAVAVVGVGAVGGVVAARLCAAGRDVILCVREPFDELVVETSGGTLRSRPTVRAAPDGLAPFPWVLVATKAHQTAGAADWLRALVTSHTRVVILQNGVEHEERVAPYAQGATLLPAVVDCRAFKAAPGRIVQHTPLAITVPDSAAGRSFAELLARTDAKVTVTDDFATAAWRKLCLNVAGGAITALTDRTVGVVRRPEVARVARDLVRECIRVGRAEGARLDDELADEIVAAMLREPVEAGTSMLTDRRAGRPLEAEARNGAVARIGARHGIAAPLNQALTALLDAINQDA